MEILRKWLWERAGFTLAVLVLVGFVCGYVLPVLARPIGLVCLALAIAVVVKEGRSLTS